MAPLRSKAVHHGRSLSFPSTSDQATTQIHENLYQVQASQADSSLSTFSDRISGIKKLYHNLDDYLALPHIRKTISQESQEKWVDQVLDGHLQVLDASNTAKDIFSHIKRNVQDLLSALRRKDSKGVQCYLSSRKSSRKLIYKSLKDLRSSRNKHTQCSDNEVVFLLREAESATVVLLDSLLSYATGNKTQAKQHGWSLISKLMQSNKVADQDEETDFNEFVKVDAFLKRSQEDDKQCLEIVNHLKGMESSIQILEEELECLFRQLIKTRVFFLNVLNY